MAKVNCIITVYLYFGFNVYIIEFTITIGYLGLKYYYVKVLSKSLPISEIN